MKNLQSRYLLSWIWGIFITILSLIPSSSFGSAPFMYFDKLVHFVFYFVFILSLLWSASMFDLTIKKIFIYTVFVITYGFTIELAQGLFCSTRFFEWYDVWSNTGAAILGALLVWFWSFAYPKTIIINEH